MSPFLTRENAASLTQVSASSKQCSTGAILKRLGKKQLKDFIGSDSWTMFNLLEISSSFVNNPIKEWDTCDSYVHGKEVLSNLPVVNDAAERALGLATNMNTNRAPKSKDQKQNRYKVVKAVRDQLKKFAT